MNSETPQSNVVDVQIVDSKPVIPWEIETPIIKRNADGTWAKGQSGNTGGETSIGQRVAIWFRKALEGIDPDDPEGRYRIQAMFERMFKIATNDSALHMKEAIWAFNALMERAYGVPVKDKSELDAMARQGGTTIQVLVLPAAPPTGKDEVKLLKPEFE